MTSVTNMTSQAPAPVSLRTIEVLIRRPSLRMRIDQFAAQGHHFTRPQAS